MIAAFAHLEITNMREIAGENPHPGMLDGHIVDQATLVKLGDQTIDLGGTKKEIDLGERLDELGLVPLHHAPETHDRAARASVLETTGLDERVDGFLLCRVDEAAGVDDDNLGLFEVRREFGTAIGKLSDVALAIDGVLVAAEGEERELQRGTWNGGGG